MNKKQFIKELKSNLKHLQDEELNEVLADYEEHIEVGKSQGRKEQEIIKALGKPKIIAKHVVANSLVEKAKKERSTKNILRAVLATIALGFFNIIFVLGPFLAIVGVLIGLFAAGVGLIVGGVVGIIALQLEIVTAGIPIVAAICFLICFVTLGILILMGSSYLGELFGNLMLKYLKLNINLIKTTEEKVEE